MPLFGSGGSLIEQEIEKATQETVIKEDVSVMYEICDRVNSTPDGAKEAYHCIMKRLQNLVPKVNMMALTLLDICVMNCGKKFHLEVCSRHFTTECKKILSKSHFKVQDRLKALLIKWAANEFKADPQLALVENFVLKLKQDGVDFNVHPEGSTEGGDVRPPTQQVVARQEDDDLAKAIELSLAESKGNPKAESLYPSMNTKGPPTPTTTAPPKKEQRKVRALYDFEAAEENELSFKAGEVIIVLEDRDPNWWKGSNHRGDGLFPSNFVTSDLEAPAVDETHQPVIETQMPQQITQIDEGKIDSLLGMLHDADPTSLQRTDHDAQMEMLEAECAMMNPLIDQELEKIDRRHASLSTLSRRLTDGLSMYHHLLRQPMMPPQHFAPQMMPPMPSLPPQYYAHIPPGFPGGLPPPPVGMPMNPPMGYYMPPGMNGMMPPEHAAAPDHMNMPPNVSQPMTQPQ